VTRRVLVSMSLVALMYGGLPPRAALAQTASAITGTVRDATGGVLPGVTVEASSPALLEKVRTVVSDSEGVYRIIELRPGAYTVTFSLVGFNRFTREGLELPAGFTATVNAEMRVGAVEETVTVSGEASLVDAQTVQQRRVLSVKTTEALPIATRAPGAYVVFFPGVVQDQANQAEPYRDLRRVSIRGASTADNVETLDGAKYPMLNAGGGWPTQFYFNMGNAQEIAVDTSGLSIESQLAGMVTNIIPREGANEFHGDFVAAYSDENLAQSNLTDELRLQGLTGVNRSKELWDYNASWGGPLKQGKLWFWNSYRYWGTENYKFGVYFNKILPPAWGYDPDLDRQFVERAWLGSTALRLTWQAATRHKFSGYFDYNPNCFCDRSNTGEIQSPEATDNWYNRPNNLFQLSWKAPLTSRLFLQANTTIYRLSLRESLQFRYGTNLDVVPAFDTQLAVRYRAMPMVDNIRMGGEDHNTELYRASANYVTGSHNFKAGFEFRHGLRTGDYQVHGNSMQVQTRNFVPFQITQWAKPLLLVDEMNADGGLFAGHEWTHKRLLLNLGVRWEYLTGSVPAQSVGAGPFVSAREYAAVKDVPNWDDVVPRFAFAYDLFGDGRTAVKGTWGKYVAGEQLGLTRINNPQERTISNVNRDWRDADGDFVPDCDLNNRFKNGECEQVSNLNFGLNNPNATQIDPELLTGSGKRTYSWEQSLQFERELRTGLSASVGYFRRSYYLFRVTENLQVTPADYSPFSVMAPTNPRLPGGGGYLITGLYDISKEKFGRATNFTTLEKNFGERTQVSDFVEVNGNARLRSGIQIRGGVSVGRVATNSCFVVDSPQALLNCDVKPPFRPDWKALAVIPLPWWGLQVGATLQNTSGNEITASWVAPASAVLGLGRELASGANGTVTVPLIKPGTMFAERVTRVDGRVTKRFRVGRYSFEGSLDALNLANSSGVLSFITTFGGNWLRPQSIQTGRQIKLTGNMSF
jgi:hypothetical protein